MAFIRKEEKKGMSLPGLIDIIFLLLIFSLVTLSVSQAKVETESAGNRDMEIDLPESKSRETEEVDEILQNLTFQIELTDPDDTESNRIVFILHPSISDSLTLKESKDQAVADSLFAEFPENFSGLSDYAFQRLEPCVMIKHELAKFKEDNFFMPDPTNSIMIRAVKNTEFRIINFLMESCAAYGDTIPGLVFRTLTGKEVKSGIY